MYRGMDAGTGRVLSDQAHIRQSIHKILTTPRGTRVMRRDFGSDIPDLIDQPLTDRTRLRVMAATAGALIRWEPRIRVSRVTLSSDGPQLSVSIEATIKRGGVATAFNLQLGRAS
jgi:phage baseplate assembly protein W